MHMICWVILRTDVERLHSEQRPDPTRHNCFLLGDVGRAGHITISLVSCHFEKYRIVNSCHFEVETDRPSGSC